MAVDKFDGRYLRIGVACLGTFAALDAFMRVSSEEYRDSLGRTGGVFGSSNIVIVALDASLVVFYSWVYGKVTEGKILSPLLLWHGLLYGLIGLAMCLPWIGMFFALLTPVGVLFLSALLWTPFGYAGSLGVAIAFVAFNIYLVWVGLKSGKKDRAIA